MGLGQRRDKLLPKREEQRHMDGIQQRQENSHI